MLGARRRRSPQRRSGHLQTSVRRARRARPASAGSSRPSELPSSVSARPGFCFEAPRLFAQLLRRAALPPCPVVLPLHLVALRLSAPARAGLAGRSRRRGRRGGRRRLRGTTSLSASRSFASLTTKAAQFGQGVRPLAPTINMFEFQVQSSKLRPCLEPRADERHKF